MNIYPIYLYFMHVSACIQYKVSILFLGMTDFHATDTCSRAPKGYSPPYPRYITQTHISCTLHSCCIIHPCHIVLKNSHFVS